MLTAGARGKGAPSATERDMVNLLLAVMAGGPQIDAPRVVVKLRALKLRGGFKAEHIGRGNDGAAITATKPLGPFNNEAAERPLGDLLQSAVTMAHQAGPRQGMLTGTTSLSVWHGGEAAMIEFTNGERYFYEAPHDPAAFRPVPPALPIRTMATVGVIAIAHLSDLSRPPEQQFLPLETKDAPQHEASGASESMVVQRPAKAVDLPQDLEDATSGDSGIERELDAPSNVVELGLDPPPRKASPNGQTESLRVAAGP